MVNIHKYPIFYRVSAYIPGGAEFCPSTVVQQFGGNRVPKVTFAPLRKPEARNLKTKFLKLVAKQVPGPARVVFFQEKRWAGVKEEQRRG